jgi:hypothetical protein
LACPQHIRLGVNLGNADCPVLPVEGTGLDVIQTARGRPLRASDAEQHDRALRSLSSGAHSRDPLASPGERCTASRTREELALAAVICPSGSFVSSPLCKNISLHPSGKSSLQIRAIPPHYRGVSRSSRTRGTDAVDAAASGAQRGCRAGWRKAREQSNGELTNDAEAYGEVVWS